MTVADAIPESPGYSQVRDLRFGAVFALTAAPQNDYLAFVRGGGGLFVMGENASVQTRNASVASLLASLGAGSIGFNHGLSATQTTNAPFTGPTPLASVTCAAPGGFGSAGNCRFITRTGSSGIACAVGTMTNAAAGAFTSILDVNVLQVTLGAGNEALARNLVGFVGEQVRVPEPAAMAILGLGLLGLGLARRRVAA